MAYLPQQVGQDPITKALGYLSRQIDQLKKFTFNTTISGSITGVATSDNQTNGSQKTQVVSAGGTNIDFATATKQTDGTQKTQLVDASGNALPTNGTPQRTEVEVIRPSDIFGYSIGDAINSSTSSPVAFELTNMSTAAGGGGFITKLKVETNITAMANASLRIYFFRDTPANITADNVAMTLSYANSSKRSFYIDVVLDSLVAGSDSIFGQTLDLSTEYACLATSMYFTIQTNSAFTPTSGGKIKVIVSSLKLN